MAQGLRTQIANGPYSFLIRYVWEYINTVVEHSILLQKTQQSKLIL